MKEKDIEQKFVKTVRNAGGLCWKFVSPGTAGVPDRIVLMRPGRVAFVELKAPGKKLRPLQIKRKRQLESLGFRVYVVDDPRLIDKILNEIGGDAQ